METTESEMNERIRLLLTDHLAVQHKLNTVEAVPERLRVYELSGELFLTVKSNVADGIRIGQKFIDC